MEEGRINFRKDKNTREISITTNLLAMGSYTTSMEKLFTVEYGIMASWSKIFIDMLNIIPYNINKSLIEYTSLNWFKIVKEKYFTRQKSLKELSFHFDIKSTIKTEILQEMIKKWLVKIQASKDKP
jgi:hypothetical protein